MTDPSSSSTAQLADPLTSPIEALYWTQYSIWYPIFRRHAPKSTIIDIAAVQPELLDWLESDTFVLPSGSGPSTLPSSYSASSSFSGSSGDEESREIGGEEEEEEEEQAVKLEAMDAAIRKTIDKFDGPVFPKLNWSAPLDASFMLAGNTLQCLHPEDVYLLLKSSEFVGRDLEQIAATTTATDPVASSTVSDDATAPIPESGKVDRSIRPHLVLKKWFPLQKSYEFRCFVRSHHLIAISQRDITFFDHLQSSYLQNEVRGAIVDFFEDVLSAAQQDGRWALGDYVFDVYLTKDLGRVWLIDVNGWLPRTDALLFGWDELEELHLREKACRQRQPDVIPRTGPEEGVLRLNITPQNRMSEQAIREQEAWGESDIQLRVLSDRRMQSAGGAGATYSSNMVPKDLVEFAKASNGASGQAMSVDQIVSRWNHQVDLQDKDEL